ncbi:DUF4148 domain-containing protein [Achromobacter sp. SD115]|uniref:DUF4148 domain-containing protein n=1 Tax=Achromobacter sp. SD115 TaxID=2782011 RepID=UPI001A9611A8|nr:DUF4148 domain-containing protein [Achromobacter sp. SD115]MBO1014187.1 DUF4148 domain-containing protein [Achromobacter sp. SD115]
MKTLVSALILSASFIGAAQAGELDYPPALNTESTVTRAQVQEELAQARANGELVSNEEGSTTTIFAASGDKSRAQVQKELAAARAQGLTDSSELAYPPVQG